MKSIRSSWFPVSIGIIFFTAFYFKSVSDHYGYATKSKHNDPEDWQPPDINLVPQTAEGEMIRYGRDLIVHTSTYFGPKGNIAPITNGMNCQNCHIWAGVKPFGNSFASVASTYPKFRDRSGILESVEFRINDCMERSLNGTSIDSASKEMKAMVAYLNWVGQFVKKGVKPTGSGNPDIPYLNRAADPINGKSIYVDKCQRCHGHDGEGLFYEDSTTYRYPPLWGQQSYNVSAGLYRLSRLAGFIKYNMPFDLAQSTPQLTDEEAWDVAAFICSQPRPEKKFTQDWPVLEKKPLDYPFGPYADRFSEHQHKYGPFLPIKEELERSKQDIK
ncbi:MAG: c-type cytochrome [Chitinophagaceae bacterium]